MRNNMSYTDILQTVDAPEGLRAPNDAWGSNLAKFLNTYLSTLRPDPDRGSMLNNIIPARSKEEVLHLLKRSFLMSDRVIVLSNSVLTETWVGVSGPLADPFTGIGLDGEEEFVELLKFLSAGISTNNVVLLPAFRRSISDWTNQDGNTRTDDVVSTRERLLQHSQSDCSVISAASVEAMGAEYTIGIENYDEFLEAFSMEMPFLAEADMGTLIRLKRDYDVEFQNFRIGLKDAIREYRSILPGDSEALLVKRAKEIRSDVLDKECAALRRTYSRVLRYRSIRAATGAVIGSAPAIMQILGVPGGEVLKGIVGAGGIGFLIREYADFFRETDQLKDNSMYIVWKLGR